MVIGSDNASLVVNNFDPSLTVSWPVELAGNVPGGSEPESKICGRMENVPLMGVARLVVGCIGDGPSSGAGDGRVVRILLAGRMSDVETALSRRVAADGMET